MNVYEAVTDRILKKLEEGVIPWRKTWTSGFLLARLAHSPPRRAAKPNHSARPKGRGDFLLTTLSVSQPGETQRQSFARASKLRAKQASTLTSQRPRWQSFGGALWIFLFHRPKQLAALVQSHDAQPARAMAIAHAYRHTAKWLNVAHTG